ncbi:CFEM domain-containing protein [Colletotrichum karsti]|uniref:CFEM domain-containing protein n=1 Tax=Colletotrichum karsti TaxID=1095194 RepID=A0A9P6IBS5_9PEZI|nr:CFEM domain-containing protein [Colletotrichum karsti]KAF9879457.1 CFEM domain-containing protein [Colletotrichum karsti]
MKFTLALLAAGLVAAQDFSGQPECAIPCLRDAIPKVGCALTDTACQCAADKQEQLVPFAAPCLLSACNSADLGKAQAAAADACKKFLATASAGSARPTATGSAAASAASSASAAVSSAAASVSASASRAASVASSAASAVASASRNATSSASTTLSGTRTPSATPTGTGASASASATGAASQGNAAMGGVAVAALFGIVAAL